MDIEELKQNVFWGAVFARTGGAALVQLKADVIAALDIGDYNSGEGIVVKALYIRDGIHYGFCTWNLFSEGDRGCQLNSVLPDPEIGYACNNYWNRSLGLAESPLSETVRYAYGPDSDSNVPQDSSEWVDHYESSMPSNTYWMDYTNPAYTSSHDTSHVRVAKHKPYTRIVTRLGRDNYYALNPGDDWKFYTYPNRDYFVEADPPVFFEELFKYFFIKDTSSGSLWDQFWDAATDFFTVYGSTFSYSSLAPTAFSWSSGMAFAYGVGVQAYQYKQATTLDELRAEALSLQRELELLESEDTPMMAGTMFTEFDDEYNQETDEIEESMRIDLDVKYQ